MVKKKFTACKMEVLLFDRRDVIETSSFEGDLDGFYDEDVDATNRMEDNYS